MSGLTHCMYISGKWTTAILYIAIEILYISWNGVEQDPSLNICGIPSIQKRVTRLFGVDQSRRVHSSKNPVL